MLVSVDLYDTTTPAPALVVTGSENGRASPLSFGKFTFPHSKVNFVKSNQLARAALYPFAPLGLRRHHKGSANHYDPCNQDRPPEPMIEFVVNHR
jgi:hypothetical protein